MSNDKNEHWWEDRTLPEKIVLGIGLGILGLGAVALFGWVTMALWNWLMPEIFKLPKIDYWQTWGLLVLSAILLGRLGGSSGGSVRSDRKRRRELRRKMQQGRQENWDRDFNAGRSDEPGRSRDEGSAHAKEEGPYPDDDRS